MFAKSAKFAKNIAAPVKYAAPATILLLIYSIWIYGRLGDFGASFLLAAPLSALTAIAFHMGKSKFLDPGGRKRKFIADASKGRMELLCREKGDALALLLDTMGKDYQIEIISVLSGAIKGRYDGHEMVFSIAQICEGGVMTPEEALELYRICAKEGAEKGVVFLTAAPGKRAAEFASKLNSPEILLIPPDSLSRYFAKIGEKSTRKASCKSPKPRIFTRNAAKKCVFASGYMLIAYIALGLKWFLPPALLLAAFAVICRYKGETRERLF